jgi:rhamnosyltransferase
MTMSVGVVIRTLNESEFIVRCIETLQRQGYELDILVVDSGSTDDTVALAEGAGTRILHMSPDDFDYSKSLNIGIEEVRGDLVVLLSAHSIPIEDDWLATMLAPFDDPRVAGVNCRQVPWPDAPWWEVRRLTEIFPTERLLYDAVDRESIVFSNAASCIRRSVWADHPFTLPAAEDMDWAQRMVDKGYSIVYEPGATVYHSHDEGPRAQARRMIDLMRADASVVRTRRRTLREAAVLAYGDGRAALALKEPLSKRAGYLVELAKMVWYYVIDFDAKGTTAERRRRELERSA